MVVAGCSSGIGRAVAERLSRTCSVFGGSRRITHPTAWVYRPLDVTDAATVDAFMGWVLDKAGHIDVLIASAGVGLAGAVEDTDDDEALRQFDVNVLGTTRLIRAVLPPMRKRGSGKIIVVGSIGGLIGLPFAPYYSASKFALAGLVEALRGELQPTGIQATIVHPGDLKTEFGRHRIVARRATQDSAYEGPFRKTLAFYAAQEEAGPGPEALAATIERLLWRRTLPARVIHGSVLERLGALGKSVLPPRLFEEIMRIAYGPRN